MRFSEITYHPHAEKRIADPKRALDRTQIERTLQDPHAEYTGHSGRQIAERLNESGRTVTVVIYTETAPGHALILSAHRLAKNRSRL